MILGRFSLFLKLPFADFVVCCTHGDLASGINSARPLLSGFQLFLVPLFLSPALFPLQMCFFSYLSFCLAFILSFSFSICLLVAHCISLPPSLPPSSPSLPLSPHILLSLSSSCSLLTAALDSPSHSFTQLSPSLSSLSLSLSLPPPLPYFP